MKILLIDADSTIPNLALMKLSTFYKNNGDTVDLERLHLPYYPNKKKHCKVIPDGYDRKFCSVIFQGNKEYVLGNDIIFGGTGVSLDVKLDQEIETLEPDYSLYPDNKISYGFITRGCIRKCYFCKVPKKEGLIHFVKEPENIMRSNITKFLDNNILAFTGHKEILERIIKTNKKIQFNQGLDIRLIDQENSLLLSKLNYYGEYIFAFDDIGDKDIVEEKLKLLEWRKDWKFKFFVYVHPTMEIRDTVKRIEWLRERRLLPYIMRDITCWDSGNSDFFIDIAAYCNQVHVFKSMTFSQFIEKRHTNRRRIIKSKSIYNFNNV